MLQLHFPNRQQADVPLTSGVCPVVRHASGQILAGISAVGMLPLARFSLDARGLWLQVIHDGSRVHLNGRPVQRMAVVRAGDQLNVDGQDIHVIGRHDTVEEDLSALALLRAHGGRLHGRAFSLQRAWVMGSSREADITLDDRNLPPLLLRVHNAQGQLHLQVLPEGRTVGVNGIACTQCRLHAGDQIVIDAMHRFVVESPRPPVPAWPGDAPALPRTATPAPVAATPARAAWPWLLLAALAMAAMLAALLMFGTR